MFCRFSPKLPKTPEESELKLFTGGYDYLLFCSHIFNMYSGTCFYFSYSKALVRANSRDRPFFACYYTENRCYPPTCASVMDAIFPINARSCYRMSGDSEMSLFSPLVLKYSRMQKFGHNWVCSFLK